MQSFKYSTYIFLFKNIGNTKHNRPPYYLRIKTELSQFFAIKRNKSYLVEVMRDY